MSKSPAASWCLELGIRKTGEQLLPELHRRLPSFRLLPGPVVSWTPAVTAVPPQPHSRRPAQCVQGQSFTAPVHKNSFIRTPALLCERFFGVCASAGGAGAAGAGAGAVWHRDIRPVSRCFEYSDLPTMSEISSTAVWTRGRSGRALEVPPLANQASNSSGFQVNA